jgi:hypothetical protein
MSDAAGAEAWSYDSMGRTLVDRRTTNAVTKNTSFTYAPFVDGSLYQLTAPSSRVLTYGYDTAGSATPLQTPALASTTPPAPPTRLKARCPSSKTAQAFIPLSFSSCTQTGVANAAILDFQYDFGLGSADNGNVKRVANRRATGRSITYQYDELNRMLPKSCPPAE